MWIVYFFLAVVLGLVFGSFLLVNGLMSIFFGLRFTARLKSQGVLLNSSPYVKYSISAVLLLSLYSLSIWVYWSYFPAYRWTYLIASLVPFVMGLGSLLGNASSIQEYVASNRASIAPDFIAHTEAMFSLQNPRDGR